MRTHEVAKPFTCNICKQAFNVQSNFSAHMKTHNQKKPYPCSMCEKRFNDPLGFPFNALIMENLCQQPSEKNAHSFSSDHFPQKGQNVCWPSVLYVCCW